MVKRPPDLADVRRELEDLARVGLSRALSADETARHALLLGYEQLLLIGTTSVESAWRGESTAEGASGGTRPPQRRGRAG